MTKPSFPLKIMSVSLMGLQKYKAYAVFDGEALVITHILPIKGAFGSWKTALIDEIKQKKEVERTGIVEERTEYISIHASAFNLEAMDMTGETGRSNFYVALDWYFGLLEMGQIVIAQEYQQFLLRLGGEGQKVEKGMDEKGRVTYSINWDAISTGHRAVLLCVVGAMIEPVSDRYIEEMLNLWLPVKTIENPVDAFVNALRRTVREKADRLSK